MRQLQKIVQLGNSSAVVIPRQALFWLGWLPGQAIVLELTEDKKIIIREPVPEDVMSKRARPVLLDPFPKLTP